MYFNGEPVANALLLHGYVCLSLATLYMVVDASEAFEVVCVSLSESFRRLFLVAD